MTYRSETSLPLAGHHARERWRAAEFLMLPASRDIRLSARQNGRRIARAGLAELL